MKKLTDSQKDEIQEKIVQSSTERVARMHKGRRSIIERIILTLCFAFVGIYSIAVIIVIIA